MRHYLLIDKKVVAVNNTQEWLHRRVALPPNNDQIAHTIIGETEISTVFTMGINHNYSGRGAPILFETMTFGGVLDEMQRRYRTYEEAEKGHAEIVEILKDAQHELDKMFLLAVNCDLDKTYERDRISGVGAFAGTAGT